MVNLLERLQKVMAKAGVASRRHSEELIAAGEVKVNGKIVTELGLKVDPGVDSIMVRGKPLAKSERKHYLMLYKPRGYVSTVQDEKGRKNVLDLLEGFKERVYPVGRLDYASEGLLLLTNDGDLTYGLTHPKNKVPRIYLARVSGQPQDEKLTQLKEGIPLDGKLTAPAKVKVMEITEEKTLLEITVREGRNRQIRRMCDYIGHPVLRLLRIGIGNIRLENLRPGQYRPLSDQELKILKKIAGMGG
jgi:pseudouridine synthase